MNGERLMATKKQKRLAGELKAAQQREESRLSGLAAQKQEKDRREREFQMAAVARSGKKIHFVDPGPKSKIALEKEARVKKRLEELALVDGEGLEYDEVGGKDYSFCDKYKCVYKTEEEHEKICPGNVSFREHDD